ARPSLATPSATRSGSFSSSGSGRPVRTLQKAQARVQVSPMIMKVAWRLSQHSPMLGQRASSQTVASLDSRTRFIVSANTGEPGARTRIQGGLRATGWSGRGAFSGWRPSGLARRSAISMSRIMGGYVGLVRGAVKRGAFDPDPEFDGGAPTAP